MQKDLRLEIATVERDITFPAFGGVLRVNDDTLLSRGGALGLKLYDDIERDCLAYGLITKRKLAVIARSWEVVPGGDSRKDKKAADLAAEMLKALDFDRLTEDLLDAVLKGFAVGEIIWATNGSTIYPEAVKPKDQRRFTFGEDYALRLLTPSDFVFGMPVPERKFIVHTFGSKDGNPRGLGLGSRLFWPVFFKRQDIRFWLTFIDKYGSPTAVGKYPSGTSEDDKSKLLRALDAISREAGVVIPEDLAVELLEAKRQGVGTHEQLCRYMDEQISYAILGDAPGAKDSGGALASSAILRNEVRLELVQADADMLSATLNKTLLTWITELNVPGAVPPQVWRDAKPSEDLKTRSERDRNLAEVGYRPTLAHVTEAYGGEWEAVPASNPATPQAEPGQEFAEGQFPDQAALDRAADGLPAAQLDQAMTAMLEPVFEALRRGDAAEAQSLLGDAFPGLDAQGLEDLLARALFVSELWGRISAGR